MSPPMESIMDLVVILLDDRGDRLGEEAKGILIGRQIKNRAYKCTISIYIRNKHFFQSLIVIASFTLMYILFP